MPIRWRAIKPFINGMKQHARTAPWLSKHLINMDQQPNNIMIAQQVARKHHLQFVIFLNNLKSLFK